MGLNYCAQAKVHVAGLCCAVYTAAAHSKSDRRRDTVRLQSGRFCVGSAAPPHWVWLVVVMPVRPASELDADPGAEVSPVSQLYRLVVSAAIEIVPTTVHRLKKDLCCDCRRCGCAQSHSYDGRCRHQWPQAWRTDRGSNHRWASQSATVGTPPIRIRFGLGRRRLPKCDTQSGAEPIRCGPEGHTGAAAANGANTRLRAHSGKVGFDRCIGGSTSGVART